jgi:hypothetical protein
MEETKAYTLGYAAGKDAASWVFDGNTTRAYYEYVLKGIEEGDPMVYDGLSAPSLAWAGTPTRSELAEELGLGYVSDELDAACEEWDAGALDGFWHEVERAARYQLED